MGQSDWIAIKSQLSWLEKENVAFQLFHFHIVECWVSTLLVFFIASLLSRPNKLFFMFSKFIKITAFLFHIYRRRYFFWFICLIGYGDIQYHLKQYNLCVRRVLVGKKKMFVLQVRYMMINNIWCEWLYSIMMDKYV